MNQDKLMVFTRVVVVVAVLYAILCSVAKADSVVSVLTPGAAYERVSV